MSLEIRIESGDFATSAADALAVLVSEGGFEKQPAFAHLDKALGGALAAHVSEANYRGRVDEVLDVPTLGRIAARRVILVGTGKRKVLSGARLRSSVATATRAALNTTSFAIVPGDFKSSDDVRRVAEGVGLGAYTFTKYFTGERLPKRVLGDVTVYKRGRATTADKRALDQGMAVARAVNIARDAVNEPPNVLTPEGLAEAARKVAKEGKLKITVLDEKGMAKAGMRLHLAVAQGSANPPRFIHLSYTPKRAKSKIVFVGKGLTFDSGGLCIKPAPGMGDMKTDMGGAAAVLGLMAAIKHLKPRVEVHGIIGAAENMPDGEAYRPADVFTSLAGKTVEIINTDAEGRLVLADALAYAARLEPDLVVDAATLTGAALVALGKTCSPYYATSDDVAQKFEGAARDAGESFWRLPLLDELAEQLKSDIADFKHTGDRYGGSILAALFLREFVGGYPWIHCDVAGPVYAERARGIYPKGATGHPVLTFVNLVEGFAR